MLIQKEQLLNNVLLKGIQDMVYIMEVTDDRRFIYHFINQAVEKFAGLKEDIIGKTFHQVLNQQKADFLYQKYQEVLDTKSVVVYEDLFPSPIGEVRYGENVLTPLFDENNTCTHIVAVVKDITERRLAEKTAKKATELLVEGKQRYQSLFDYNLDGVIATDENGIIVNVNRSLEFITGYAQENLKGMHYTDLILSEDVRTAQTYFEIAINGILEEFNIRMCSKSGKQIDMILKLTPIIINDKTVGIYAICKDMSEQISMQNKYTESENKFEIIAEYSGDLITMLDREGNITYVSPSYQDVLQFDQEDYIGKEFYYNVHPDDIAHLLASFEQSKASGKPWEAQFRQKHKKLGWIWSELKGSPVYDEHNQFKQMVVLSRDISLRKSYEEKLKYFAYHDPLTGLPNRRYFTMQLKQALDSYENTGEMFAVIIMDLDRFKEINDTFGHDIGDKAIAEFAYRVGKKIRRHDTLARLGGDEFVLLVQSLEKKADAIHIAEDIIDVVKAPWKIDDAQFVTTASIGISLLAVDKENTYETLFKNADQALYEAKNAGGNQYAIKM
ncbi:PAS domain S-box protein [Ornithinibacillus sp. BX22]|uniref:PAS domain S-box protein n=2 Tax=Ornithinibacillus TaxID=484508 RepID=A0A923L4U2_9BACI|nr:MULTISPECIES: PAS domain S-box protein [Ornithinibacillus]MBC5636461.1 PAS domain S-box protein [Ornithinibacillus hominis]MBS3680698.1 PAS domain S-box protein [Ornithinibacillus massiliensis]